MKKLLSVLMVLTMVLSLGVTAFAAEQSQIGSITIVNPTIGQTYNLYKLFDASAADGHVAYSIDSSNQFFAKLFKNDGTPAEGNTFFTYNSNNKQILKVEGVNETDLLNYVKSIVQGGTYQVAGSIEAKAENLTDEKIVFANVPCGYYIVDVVGTNAAKGMITVTTNTPDAVVIDKNQMPFANGIEKKVCDVKLDENDEIVIGNWLDDNTAFVGDVVGYKVSFNATNYAGMEKIRYYTIHDEKGNALWVEFGDDENPYDIVVKVGDTQLTKGYYHLANKDIETETQEWEYIGDWSDVAENERDPSDAEWYLVHYGYDLFEIVIPWLEGHQYVDPTFDSEGERTSYTFELTFDDNAASKFDSNTRVEVIYYASVEPNADIGKTDNLLNKAFVKWTGKHTTKASETDTVYTHVDGIGIHKMDSTDNDALPGAVFDVYMDEACTIPLRVVPTDIEGVYVYDDSHAPGQAISGENKQTAEDKYAGFFGNYFTDNPNGNRVTTPKNGKIVITGLKKGTYYIKEIEAPDGYNSLSEPIAVEAGDMTDRFYIYASDPIYPNPGTPTGVHVQGKVDDIQNATPTYKQYEYIVAVAEVYNTPGTVLPSTGGEGTFWMITIGTLMAICFAVFLITHKKMSIYTD